jgi:hypothetical protein
MLSTDLITTRSPKNAQRHPPELEAATQAFIDGLPTGKPLYTLSPTDARAVLSSAQQAATVTLADVQLKDVTLPIGPTAETHIPVMRPVGATGVLPVVIYMHGGGWVLGDRETHDRLLRELTTGIGAAIVFVDYERSPEARYPVAIEQGYAVAKYVADNAERQRRRPRTWTASKSSRWIVEHQHFGGHRQGPHDGDALLFAARHLARIGVLAVLQPEAAEHFKHPGAGVVQVLPQQFYGAEDGVFQRRHVRVEIEALEDHADRAADGGDGAVVAPDALAVEGDAAALEGFEPVDAAQQRRFAGAARADEDHDLAGMDGDRHVVEDDVGAKTLAEVADIEQGGVSGQRQTSVRARRRRPRSGN